MIRLTHVAQPLGSRHVDLHSSDPGDAVLCFSLTPSAEGRGAHGRMGPPGTGLLPGETGKVERWPHRLRLYRSRMCSQPVSRPKGPPTAGKYVAERVTFQSRSSHAGMPAIRPSQRGHV